jgi:dihydroorotase
MFLFQFYDTIRSDWLCHNTLTFLVSGKKKTMKSDEKRSHRLNYLLKCYLTNPTENELYERAKQMGVTDSTAKDYIRTVIIQAQKIHSK